MKISAGWRVTILQRLRSKLGLVPHTAVTLEETDGSVVIRPAQSKRELIEERLRKVRGAAGGGANTDSVIRLTRGHE